MVIGRLFSLYTIPGRVGKEDARRSERRGHRPCGFETLMDMNGKNGKTAKVIAAWIQGDSDAKMRLTSIYVTERKG